MTVALYARVSTVGQDPEVQLVALRAHAAQRGWQVVQEFVDCGVSGAKERRPALDRLMKAAWAGQFQASSRRPRWSSGLREVLQEVRQRAMGAAMTSSEARPASEASGG